MLGKGLGMLQQEGQEEKRAALTAADRGLEFDPDKKIYRPTQAREDRESAQTGAIKAQSGLAQKADQRADAKLGLETKKFQAQKQQFAQTTELQSKKTNIAYENQVTNRMAETRLLQTARLKSQQDYQTAQTKIEDKAHARIKSIDARLDRVKFKELDAREATNSPLQQMLMQSNPEYAKTVERINAGSGSEEDYGRMIQSLQAEKDMEIIGLAAKTGLVKTIDFDTPVMKRYMNFRALTKGSLNNIVTGQMRAMQAAGQSAKGGMQMWGGDVEGRERMLNRMSAELFQNMEGLNAMRAALGATLESNQSQVDTGGAQPAVTGGGQGGGMTQAENEQSGDTYSRPMSQQFGAAGMGGAFDIAGAVGRSRASREGTPTPDSELDTRRGRDASGKPVTRSVRQRRLTPAERREAERRKR
jgi:hypothetical protein